MPNFVPPERHLSAHGYWSDLPPGQYPPMAVPAAAPDTVSFAHIYHVLRRHIWLVMAATLLGLLGGLYLALPVPRVYRATALLRVADSRGAVTAGFEENQRTIGRYADPLHSL